MERDAHYLLVGVFTLVMAVVGFFFAGLFYDKPAKASVIYDIHFDTPVEGLQRGSEVRYMGIKMGEVSEVFLSPDNSARVVVRVKLETRTPVNTATVATLRQQGLTGVPFVNLAQEDGLPANTLALETGQEFPVIRVKLTELDALVQKLPDLEKNLSVLMSAANALLNAENRQHVAGLLTNLDAASAQLPDFVTRLKQTSDNLSRLVTNVDSVVKQSEKGLASNMQALQASLTAIKQASQRVETLAGNLNRVLVNNEGHLNELLGEGGENLKQLLEESRRTAVSVRQLSDALEQNPSQLIYQPAPQGTALPR